MKRFGPVLVGLIALLLAIWLLWPRSTDVPEVPAPAAAQPAAPRPRYRAPPMPLVQKEEPRGPVECELAERTHGGLDGVRVEEVDPETLEAIGLVQATLTDGRWIRFTPRHAAGQGRIWVGENQPVVAGWLDGACLDLVDPQPWPRTTIPVRVENAAAFDEVKVLYRHEGFPLTLGFTLHGTETGELELMVGATATVVALAEIDDEAFQDEVELEVSEASTVDLFLDRP